MPVYDTGMTSTIEIGADTRKREQLDARLDEIATAAAELEISASQLETTLVGGGGDVPGTGSPVPMDYADITLRRYEGILQTLRQANGAVGRLNEAFHEVEAPPPPNPR